MDAASGSEKRVGWNLLRAVKNVRMEKSHYCVRSRKPGQDVTVRVGTKREKTGRSGLVQGGQGEFYSSDILGRKSGERSLCY